MSIGGLCAVLFVAGCAAPQFYAQVVYEDPAAFVRLERSPAARADEPQTLHAHPAHLTDEQLTHIFNGLFVQETRSALLLLFMEPAQIVPAFTEKEVAFLTQHIGTALRKAMPEEVVTFYLSTPLNATTREVTSGAVFLQKEQFHFMLSNYRTVYSIPPFGMIYDRRHPSYSLTPRTLDVVFEPSDYTIPNTVSFLERLLGEAHEEKVILDLSHFSAMRM
ncbi:MAG: hypothetical protein NPIRA02_13050 [Nitrospirales bacterium]|nr:MAG: hypothetical protein NPIRA02_13050 [Nitrospirales bacterium]